MTSSHSDVGGHFYTRDMDLSTTETPTRAVPPTGWDADLAWHDGLDVDDFDLADVDLAEWEGRGPGGSPGELVTGPGAVIDELAETVARARIATADQYRLIGDVIRDALADPTPWCGPDPTLHPDWRDPRDRGVAAVRRDRRMMAVRAAGADIAVRLRLSEAAVHGMSVTTATLRERCPRIWSLFLGGQISEPNARSAADAAGTLPEDAPEAWTMFDDRAAGPAQSLTPGRFRTRARVLREQLHPRTIDERHAQARQDRDVWMKDEPDGMASLGLRAPAADVHAAYRRIDAMARHLRAQDGETRILNQLRADVASELLLTGLGTGDSRDAARVRPVVAITVPALTLLGAGTEPATLEGYGPIDLETAKRLAGTATSWVRILTHPVTGTVLDVDRTVYRVPKAMRRWLGVHHPTCVFSGCGRPARDCEIDHDVDWQYGGTTSVGNATPKCEHHHHIRHDTLWRCDHVGDSIRWTSPTGYQSAPDPPPF